MRAVPTSTFFRKSVIRWDFKTPDFVRVSFKGLTGAFLVRVSSKGLSVDPRIFCLGTLMIPPHPRGSL
jgi:hypothetical protein